MKHKTQNKPYKNPSHHNLNFNLRFLYELKSTRFVSLKLYVGFSIFDSLSFSYFCSTKCMDCLTLKRHKSFQNQNNRKPNCFSPTLLTKLQQEVLKFNDVWILDSCGLETNFLNVEN